MRAQRVATNVKCHDCGKEGQYRGHAGCPAANAPRNNWRDEKPAIRAARTDSGGNLEDINEEIDGSGAQVVDSLESGSGSGSFDPARDAYEILEYEDYGSGESHAGDHEDVEYLRAMRSDNVGNDGYSQSEYDAGSQFEEDFMYAMRCEPGTEFSDGGACQSENESVNDLRFGN
ncbi:hypothetical protein CPB85DRAFT_1258560 [Mucidula mucida]|nr:hypothetical protein CPB85DRAFT_1258560 [Mucidula mucida]